MINPAKENRHGTNTATSSCRARRSRRCSIGVAGLPARPGDRAHALGDRVRRPSAGRPATTRPSRATDTGITRWIADDAPLVDTDVVLWYVFGIHHITRVEDWPIMPVDTISFWLKPFGFFDANPSLDAPAIRPGGHCHPEHAGR